MTTEEIIKVMLKRFKNKVLPAYNISKENNTLPKRKDKTMSFITLFRLLLLLKEKQLLQMKEQQLQVFS